jgi:DnaK suppressor protein
MNSVTRCEASIKSRRMGGQMPAQEDYTPEGAQPVTPAADLQVSEREGSGMKQEVFLPDDYRPAEDEPFMNERQTEYFRRKLLAWRNDLLEESRETIESLQQATRNIPALADRASEETDRALELRTRDRQRKLVAKIDAALRRIDNGEYGYCEVTGEPISLRRLDARPIATLSLEAQEKHERREKVHRDD